jgi:hypothetical protein
VSPVSKDAFSSDETLVTPPAWRLFMILHAVEAGKLPEFPEVALTAIPAQFA